MVTDMSNMNKEVKPVTKKKRKLSKPALMLVIGIVIIAIPCLIFGGIILSSAFNTGTPIFGDRYAGDLDPAITSDNMEKIKSEVSSIAGVEKVEVVLPSGQLRVNIDTSDDLSKEEIEAIANEAYEKVKGVLPIETYFTSTETKKMYDLAINVYNVISDDDNMIYYELTKNAMSEKETLQLVSEPLNPELVEQLENAQNPSNDAETDSSGTEEAVSEAE